MSERLTHSRSAIASTILPLAIWVYLSILYLLIFKCASCIGVVNRVFGDSFGALGIAVIAFIILVGFIPIGGHAIGLILGIVGICSKDKKRVLAIVGVILNALPLICWIVFRLIVGLEFENKHT